MLSFLFWNIRNVNLVEPILDLAGRHSVDIIVLVESTISEELFRSRSAARGFEYWAPEPPGEYISVFTRFKDMVWHSQFDSSTSRVWIRRFSVRDKPELLLVLTHLPSRPRFDVASITAECVKLGGAIRQQEALAGHSRTLLLGDLNADPFDIGLVQTTGLHAVMTREIASRGSRLVQAERYPYFYNPMWSYLGDFGDGPPATYYYPPSSHLSFFWHAFDQVLIRPDLIQYFNHSGLKILSEAGGRSLLKSSGIPDRSAGSDHLPLLLQLNL